MENKRNCKKCQEEKNFSEFIKRKDCRLGIGHICLSCNRKGSNERYKKNNYINTIKNYIHKKMKYYLFDQVIGALKVNGKIIEICRTTTEKTKDDFIRCTKLPENIEICFIDNEYHENMHQHDIYYINVNTYIYALQPNTMVDRFISNQISRMLVQTKDEKDNFNKFATTYMKRYSGIYNLIKSKEEYEIDKIVTKQLMVLLQSFFK